MGMFDNVNYTCPCSKCGHPVTNWQSKDGPCVLTHLEPADVKHFYGDCDICGTWHNKYTKWITKPVVEVIDENPHDTEY